MWFCNHYSSKYWFTELCRASKFWPISLQHKKGITFVNIFTDLTRVIKYWEVPSSWQKIEVFQNSNFHLAWERELSKCSLVSILELPFVFLVSTVASVAGSKNSDDSDLSSQGTFSLFKVTDGASWRRSSGGEDGETARVFLAKWQCQPSWPFSCQALRIQHLESIRTPKEEL